MVPYIWTQSFSNKSHCAGSTSWMCVCVCVCVDLLTFAMNGRTNTRWKSSDALRIGIFCQMVHYTNQICTGVDHLSDDLEHTHTYEDTHILRTQVKIESRMMLPILKCILYKQIRELFIQAIPNVKLDGQRPSGKNLDHVTSKARYCFPWLRSLNLTKSIHQ